MKEWRILHLLTKAGCSGKSVLFLRSLKFSVEDKHDKSYDKIPVAGYYSCYPSKRRNRETL